MKRNLYGKKMFLADLLIVSLCINALLYAAMFMGIVFDMSNIDMDFEPICKIAYVFCCLICFSAIQTMTAMNFYEMNDMRVIT